MTVFTPPQTPSYGSGVDKEYRFLQAGFGDGYDQRAGDGLNAIKETWNLKWNVLTASEASEIVAFLDAQAGVNSFEWTNPDGNTYNYICKKHSKSYDEYNNHSVSAVFEQVFGS